jgi:hypothetical protein
MPAPRTNTHKPKQVLEAAACPLAFFRLTAHHRGVMLLREN